MDTCQTLLHSRDQLPPTHLQQAFTQQPQPPSQPYAPLHGQVQPQQQQQLHHQLPTDPNVQPQGHSDQQARDSCPPELHLQAQPQLQLLPPPHACVHANTHAHAAIPPQLQPQPGPMFPFSFPLKLQPHPCPHPQAPPPQEQQPFPSSSLTPHGVGAGAKTCKQSALCEPLLPPGQGVSPVPWSHPPLQPNRPHQPPLLPLSLHQPPEVLSQGCQYQSPPQERPYPPSALSNSLRDGHYPGDWYTGPTDDPDGPAHATAYDSPDAGYTWGPTSGDAAASDPHYTLPSDNAGAPSVHNAVVLASCWEASEHDPPSCEVVYTSAIALDAARRKFIHSSTRLVERVTTLAHTHHCTLRLHKEKDSPAEGFHLLVQGTAVNMATAVRALEDLLYPKLPEDIVRVETRAYPLQVVQMLHADIAGDRQERFVAHGMGAWMEVPTTQRGGWGVTSGGRGALGCRDRYNSDRIILVGVGGKGEVL